VCWALTLPQGSPFPVTGPASVVERLSRQQSTATTQDVASAHAHGWMNQTSAASPKKYARSPQFSEISRSW
jgi:hypothetical protein